MRMRNIYLASMLMAMSSRGQYDTEKKVINEDTVHELNGLTKYYYGDNYLYALNQNTADKKAKKKGWL